MILAATFAVLMTQPIRELFQFGFAMAFGILLDTFVIRPLLVPAIARLLGDKALWPMRMRRDTAATPVAAGVR
ncbi:MMPL family transporter [Microtetraspora malaysiensis]|uniref:MMPL family transporter n=1 Tax=Microtetraspora malaysiensis TaxID=161358 RepID=UPI003D8D93AD